MKEAAPCLPTVTVAISTLGAGLARIRLPEPQAGIDYLILVQAPQKMFIEAISKLLKSRNDISLVELSSLGLSHSRNAGLERAGGDLVLFSDDDVTLKTSGILALRNHFVTSPKLVLVAGWRAERIPKGATPKKLNRFNSGRICAPEFMVRKGVIRELGVGFDEKFGLGARYAIGEDYIFVSDILRAGGQGTSVPIVTGMHPHPSTGDDWDSPDLLRARKAVISRVFGAWALPIRIAYGLRHRRKFATVSGLLSFCIG